MGRGGTGKTLKRGRTAKDYAKVKRAAKQVAVAQGATRPAAVQRMMKPSEKKNIDTDVATNVAGTLTELAMSPIVCINTCVAGALAAGNRIGRNIVMKSVFIKGRIHSPPTMTGAGFLRYVIVYDRESNGGIPAVTDIFKENAIWTMQNLGNAYRFKVLADEKFQQPISPDDNEGILFERYIKCNLPVRYVDGAGVGTYADIVEGSLWMVTWCGGTSCATLAPYMWLRARVRYEDN